MRENKAFYKILHLLPNAGKGEGRGQLKTTELLTFDQGLAFALKLAHFYQLKINPSVFFSKNARIYMQTTKSRSST